MNSNQGVTMNSQTDAERLAEIQDMCRDMGLRIPATLEEARRTHDTVSEIPEDSFSERTRFATPGQRCGRGTVRAVSDAQKKYMRFLLNTRNYRKLIGMKWWPATAVDHATTLATVETISLKGATTMISELLGCPKRAHVIEAESTGAAEPMATEKQMAWLSGLLVERIHGEGDVDVATLAKTEATAMIGRIKDAPRKPVAAPTKDDIKTIAGLYELNGNIYRMKKARSGNHFYAERCTDKETGAFEYAEGMARKVPAQGRKLTLEECEALSALMGSCCMCSRTLTATVNGVGPAARFIGPRCAATMGL